MRRILCTLAIVVVVATLFGTPRPAPACGYGLAGPVERFALANYVVIGKVVKVEDRTIVDPSGPSEQQPRQHQFRVAVISVRESLKGAEGLSAVQVGFEPSVAPKVDQEGCFYLSSTTLGFCVPSGGYDRPVYRGENLDFDKQMELPRQLSRLWSDRSAGLTSRDPQERLLTVALILTHDRESPVLDAKGTPRSLAREHREEIFQVLAAADWTKPGPYRFSPARLFRMLDLTEKEGWRPQNLKTPAALENAAKGWLRANAGREVAVRK